jgi:hypothetical protein
MTQKEATQILAILKAAYPNSYRGMSKEEAVGTVNVWATQFINIPVSVVNIAINKLISTNTFPPSIGEVKEKIRSLYFEALGELPYQHGGLYVNNTKELPPERIALLKDIVRVTEPMRTQLSIEPSLTDLLNGYEQNYLPSGQKQLTAK